MGRHPYVLGRGIKLFHQALRPRRNVVGPSVASRWANIATSIHQALGRVAMSSAHTWPADGHINHLICRGLSAHPFGTRRPTCDLYKSAEIGCPAFCAIP